MSEPHCCWVDCGARAEWEIRHGSGPCDYTHACEDHAPDLADIETSGGYKTVVVSALASMPKEGGGE